MTTRQIAMGAPDVSVPWRIGGMRATLHRELLLLTRNRTNLLLAVVPTAVYILLFATSLTNLVPSVVYKGVRVSYPDFAIPALMFSSLLAAATTSGTALFQERMGGMSLELWSYPLRQRVYVGAKLLAGTGLVIIQTLAALVVMLLLFDGHWPVRNWLALLGGAFLAAFAFNGLYLVLAVLVRDFQRFTVLINVIAPVLFFASPSFYPLEQMSEPLRWLAWINPVTYGITALRDGLLFGFAASWPLLLLLAGVALAAASFVSRALQRRARDL